MIFHEKKFFFQFRTCEIPEGIANLPLIFDTPIYGNLELTFTDFMAPGIILTIGNLTIIMSRKNMSTTYLVPTIVKSTGYFGSNITPSIFFSSFNGIRIFSYDYNYGKKWRTFGSNLGGWYVLWEKRNKQPKKV